MKNYLKYIFIVFALALNLNAFSHHHEVNGSHKNEQMMSYQDHKHHHQLQDCGCEERDAKNCKYEKSDIKEHFKSLNDNSKHKNCDQSNEHSKHEMKTHNCDCGESCDCDNCGCEGNCGAENCNCGSHLITKNIHNCECGDVCDCDCDLKHNKYLKNKVE